MKSFFVCTMYLGSVGSVAAMLLTDKPNELLGLTVAAVGFAVVAFVEALTQR